MYLIHKEGKINKHFEKEITYMFRIEEPTGESIPQGQGLANFKQGDGSFGGQEMGLSESTFIDTEFLYN